MATLPADDKLCLCGKTSLVPADPSGKWSYIVTQTEFLLYQILPLLCVILLLYQLWKNENTE